MHVLHGPAELAEELETLAQVELVEAAVVVDGAARDVVHHEIGQALIRAAGIEQSRDVRMLEPRQNLAFVAKALRDTGGIETTATSEARDESSAAAAAEEYLAGQQPQPGDFSMELNQDQKDIRDWVHGFAADVIRPAAAEWDEREETPWPVIQEAAKIGLYGFEGIAQFWADPTGITFPIVNEEIFWGDAGIGMSLMGTTLAVAGIASSGTPQQLGEWVPQCFGTVDEPAVGA